MGSDSYNNKTLITILGPTASGKTSFAIELARKLDTEIISSDSRQMYREMRIVTAVPSDEELAAVKHHLIGKLSIQDYYNASMFETEVMKLLKDLFPRLPRVIMAGGSGMYIDAVCKGIDDIPTVDPEIRDQMAKKYKKEGIESLRKMLKELDPEYFKKVDINNPNRMLKGLEVSVQTGKPYSSFLTRSKKKRDFKIIKLGIDLPREELYERINKRVDIMLEQGLIKEARRLYPQRELNALNTVGLKELFAHFDGEYSKEKAIELIKRNTRHFARRQLTWFRRDKEIIWLGPGETDKAFEVIESIGILN